MTVDKTGDRVRDMFGQIAPRYDFLNHLLSCYVDVYWRARTVRTVTASGAAPILDVCTGTGDLAIAFWNRYDGRIPVVGCDFTHQMLQIAEQKRPLRTAPSQADVQFVEADALALPFPDDQFQIVSVAFGLRNVSDTAAGLREMTRVCQPGGQVAILEFSQPRGLVFPRIYRAYFKHVLPRVGQWVARNQQDAYNYLPESVSQFPSGEALADLMRSCGLKGVTFQPLTLGIATLYVGRKPAASVDVQESVRAREAVTHR